MRRSEANLAAVAAWVERTPWVDFLAEDPSTRSCTSICLKIVDPWFTGLAAEERAQAAKKVASLLEAEGVAYDIAPYREAPPGTPAVGRSDRRAVRPRGPVPVARLGLRGGQRQLAATAAGRSVGGCRA